MRRKRIQGGMGARASKGLLLGLLMSGLMSTAYSQVLTHRYNFNTPDDGYTVPDLVGSVNGTFTGTGSFDGNGGLNMSGADGYVDLGAGVITGYSNLTIEAWVDVGANSSWTRLFDIGDTDQITGKGCYGMDFMVINGSSAGMFEVFDTDPGSDHAPSLSFTPSLNNHGKTHVVLSYDPQAPITSIYVDGALTASSTNINIPLSALMCLLTSIQTASTTAG